MELPLRILREIWFVTVEMAPYLLFGFLMAGLLSVTLSKAFVQKHLGRHGTFDAVKAALIGIPLPICSCGVIPLAASLRQHGASRAATASFLASTPQTGVDSLLITYGLLGGAFTLIRALAALLSGILCGAAVGLISRGSNETPKLNMGGDCSPKGNFIKRALTYGFVSLPRNIAPAMAIGLILSGIISALIPENYFADRMGDSIGSLFLMLLIGTPLYVCSSASVPIALAFIKAGLSPGAALVFLITGPATNAATLTTLWSIIGKKQLAVFLLALGGSAVGAGALMNQFAPVETISEMAAAPCTCTSSLQVAWGLLLCALLAHGILFNIFKKKI